MNIVKYQSSHLRHSLSEYSQYIYVHFCPWIFYFLQHYPRRLSSQKGTMPSFGVMCLFLFSQIISCPIGQNKIQIKQNQVRCRNLQHFTDRQSVEHGLSTNMSRGKGYHLLTRIIRNMARACKYPLNPTLIFISLTA